MKRQATLSKATHPIEVALAWSLLGLQWMEMMVASGQVLARRTTRSNSPAQWFMMGTEKVDAALRGSAAMTRELARSQSADPWHAWPRVLSAGIAPARSRAKRNARR
jgi:hypothetical protein